MKRPLHTWLVFLACFTLLLAAMAWVSVTALRVDREQQTAAQRAEVEERARLALWRMDAALGALIVEESARPWQAYSPFAEAERAYTRSYTAIKQGDVLVPSRLLTYRPTNVVLHFQFAQDGRLSSPQVPTGNERDLAESGYTTRERIEMDGRRLVELQGLLNQQAAAGQTAVRSPWTSLTEGMSSASTSRPVRTVATKSEPAMLNRDLLLATCAPSPTNVMMQAGLGNNALFNNGVFTNVSRLAPRAQQLRNSAEQSARANAWAQNANFYNEAVQQQLAPGNNGLVNNGVFTNTSRSTTQGQQFKNTAGQNARTDVAALNANPIDLAQVAAPVQNERPTLVEGPLVGAWVGPALVLARRVTGESRMMVQGAWLDWTPLKKSLLASVGDLFPAADLVPAPNAPNDDSRRLAALPARLVTGTLPPEPAVFWSPVRITLGVAWLAVVLAGLAVAVLLHGAVSLSERRGAFVSAVTHELRTPLTTFKMYSEMLADGMVRDEAKRKSYLATLCSEANRLSHLVENVLAYARLERGSARSRVERVTLGELIGRSRDRLEQRAAQAEMELAVDADERARNTVVHIDVAAVEQILFNLVDNACKYAAPSATEKVIHLEAEPDGKFAMLRVRDHGRGISDDGARRLFQPFSKSAHEAAHSAPGIGLGLALCRRLSRSIGGDLRLNRTAGAGACFELLLPVTSTSAMALDSI
jgi:signal transduction histidine kinase